jgi:hypothetical protein
VVRSMPRSACAWPARSVMARAASLRLPTGRWPRFRVFRLRVKFRVKFADAGPWQGWLCSSLAGASLPGRAATARPRPSACVRVRVYQRAAAHRQGPPLAVLTT